MLFTTISAILVGIPLIALNYSQYCLSENDDCLSTDIFLYQISVFNLIGRQALLRAHAFIWLAFSIVLCLFLLYLRIYTLRTYNEINNKNVTEADYSIILRNVPTKASD